MATWIELRCENRAYPSSEGRGLNVGDRCLSHDNAGPMEMAGDTRANILETVRELEAEARKDGWKKTREGWVCPFCVKALNGAK